MLGTFNDNGQPKIEVEIKGTGNSKKVEAIIDSGFNGSLKIPYRIAFPLGLVLVAVESGMIADGNMSASLVCKGTVCIGETCQETTIDVHPADVILIGTSMLRILKKTFYLDANAKKVEMLDSREEPPTAFGTLNQ
jgi:clan AA aspartic protease